ncbi:MAG: hypothetical protein JXA20_12445 [Spirochaetes bacterium]|nr:hypothetical protein [Spirochaetota bacterium]
MLTMEYAGLIRDMLQGEAVGAALLLILGSVQVALSFRAAREVRAALGRIESPLERRQLERRMVRPVHGFRVMALLSLLLAALSIAIPLYLYGRYAP